MRAPAFPWCLLLALVAMTGPSGCSCFHSVPECHPLSCKDTGADCGELTDGCGSSLDCGTCATGLVCGGDGPNRCGSAPCAPQSCADQGKNCGIITDGCSKLLHCGDCASGQICGAAGVENVCGCGLASCAALGKNCGVIPDGCGGAVHCGSCQLPQTCGGGGKANVCGCSPTTCAAQGASCGTIPDACGSTLDCGTCTAPQTCGGGGKANACGCTSSTCASLGASCGAISDGCGNTLQCGACTAPLSCDGTNNCSCAPTVCVTPTQLVATATSTSTISLNWTGGGSATTGYSVERSPDAQTFVQIGTTTTVTSYADSGLAAGTTYWYRVRASFSGTFSAYSNVASATTLGGTNAWPMLGGDARHTGYNPAETGSPPLTKAWSFATSNPNAVAAGSGAVIVSSDGYFNGADDTVTALDSATGKTLWSYGFGNVFGVGQPSLVSGIVYVAECNNTPGTDMWAFSLSSGKPVWTAPFTAQWEHYWAPTVVGNFLFFDGGEYGGLYGFNASTGAQVFFDNQVGQFDQWSPSYLNGVLYSFVDGNLRAHDPATGTVQWTVTVPGTWYSYSMRTAPVLGDQNIFIISPPNLYAVDYSGKFVTWSTSGLAFTGMPAYAGSSVYAISGGALRAHDAATGAFQWSFPGDTALAYPPVLANGYVYVSSDANVYAVSLATQSQVWTAPTGGWLAIAEGKLYVATVASAFLNQVTAYSLSP